MVAEHNYQQTPAEYCGSTAVQSMLSNEWIEACERRTLHFKSHLVRIDGVVHQRPAHASGIQGEHCGPVALSPRRRPPQQRAPVDRQPKVRLWLRNKQAQSSRLCMMTSRQSQQYSSPAACAAAVARQTLLWLQEFGHAVGPRHDLDSCTALLRLCDVCRVEERTHPVGDALHEGVREHQCQRRGSQHDAVHIQLQQDGKSRKQLRP